MAKSRSPREAKRSKSEARKKGPKKPAARKSPAAAPKGREKPKPARPALTPLARAQRLAESAFDTPNEEEALILAERALGLSRDCADAYTILADFAGDTRQALAITLEGVAAAERSLDPQVLEEHRGSLWGQPEARPYLRARVALAQRLWWTNHRDEAIEHLQEILELNQADDQGIRHLLAARLAEMDRDAELQSLLATYDEPSTFWSFTKTLAGFRKEGDTPATRQSLAEACAVNPHVVPMLLNPGRRYEDHDPFADTGEAEEEADAYFEDFGGAWRQARGAITWLRQIELEKTLAVTQKKQKAIGPTAAAKKRLLKVPQRFGAEWQASTDRLPTWSEEGGQPIRPWSTLVIDHSEHFIIAQEMTPFAPTAEQLFDHVARAIEKPIIGDPHRPSEIQVRESPLWESIRPHLEEIGIDCIYRNELDELEYIRSELRKMFVATEQRFPALVDVAENEPATIPALYEAAQVYHRAAPWRLFDGDSAIRIEFAPKGGAESRTYFAMVMGSSNLSFGIALYNSFDSIRAMHGDELHLEEFDTPADSLSLIFSEAFEIATVDLIACETGGWPVDGPEAYPLAIAVVGREDVRPLESWEIVVLEAALRAVPGFVSKHTFYEDLVTETIRVPTSTGEQDLLLTWSPEYRVGAHECGDECDHDHDHD